MDKIAYYYTNPTKINRNVLNGRMSEYMTDLDLIHYLGKNFNKNIIKYSDIENYDNIDQLLPGKKAFKIILIEDSFNSGHWLCILKYNNTIEYWNSYGLKPSIELDGISSVVNRQLDQDVKHLNILLNKAMNKYEILYNKTKFQKFNDNVATCGRHTILRCVMFKNMNLDIYQYGAFMDELRKQFKLTYDQLVTLLVDTH
jgi:hypothetical protein